MFDFNSLTSTEWGFIGIVSMFALVLKGYALWKSAQAKHQWWFIAILVLNTLGILPIIYLLFFQPDPLVKRGKRK